MTDQSAPVISARNLTKVYQGKGGGVVACRAVELVVFAGDLVVLRGRSGAGKTTLLNLLGGLDTPTSGQVLIDGRDIATLPEAELAALRRDRLGYVFQSFGLLPMLSAAENVEVPLRIQKIDAKERDRRVADVLEQVGLTRHARQRPAELSGGQQQRVGVARAIVTRPRILLADEPTAQLDSVTAAEIITLITDLALNHDMAAVISTHAATTVGATHYWELRDGALMQADRSGGAGGRSGRVVL